MVETLSGLLARLDVSDDCRAIVLQSEGKNFCAGAMHDPDEPETLVPADDDEDRYKLVASLFGNTKPIVAAIQGSAVGAGFGLAMTADFRVAASDAKFAANFVKIGFCPGFGLTATLPRTIGLQRTALMFLTGRRFPAQEVQPWGLVDEIVEPREVRDAALRLAQELAANAPLGMLATRKRLRGDLAREVLISQGIDSPEQARLRLTKDHVEGVVAYRDRRPPVFVGQ
jgi:enoyl-CoA hydratase/carnithine racemase